MARPALVLIAVGKDHPGIVDRVSGRVYQAGCSIEDSRMSILGGEFALMALVTGSEAGLGELAADPAVLGEELGLTVTVKPTEIADDGPAERAPARAWEVRAVAVDHPGIVHKLTSVLAQCGVNVARLETSLRHAPTTGTPLFELRLEAHLLPGGGSPELVEERLREAAHAESVDLEVVELPVSAIDGE